MESRFQTITALAAVMVVCFGLAGCSQKQQQQQAQAQPSSEPPTSLTYKITTARFTLSDPKTATSGHDGSTVPGVWIDTQARVSGPFGGLFGGTIKSHLPYHIAFNLTDTSGTISRIDFTAIQITYDDGTVEPAAKAIQLPFSARARQLEPKLWHIGGKIPGVITRNQSFGLELRGHVTKADGSTLPFVIDQHYDIQLENTTKPVSEVHKEV
jgi:hypothetical protein